METPLLLLDASQCVECDFCSLACSLVKNGSANTKVARVRSVKNWLDYPTFNVYHHWRCDGQPCINSYPTEAMNWRQGC